jgi:hypothetical protein
MNRTKSRIASTIRGQGERLTRTGTRNRDDLFAVRGMGLPMATRVTVHARCYGIGAMCRQLRIACSDRGPRANDRRWHRGRK